MRAGRGETQVCQHSGALSGSEQEGTTPPLLLLHTPPRSTPISCLCLPLAKLYQEPVARSSRRCNPQRLASQGQGQSNAEDGLGGWQMQHCQHLFQFPFFFSLPPLFPPSLPSCFLPFLSFFNKEKKKCENFI